MTCLYIREASHADHLVTCSVPAASPNVIVRRQHLTKCHRVLWGMDVFKKYSIKQHDEANPEVNAVSRNVKTLTTTRQELHGIAIFNVTDCNSKELHAATSGIKVLELSTSRVPCQKNTQISNKKLRSGLLASLLGARTLRSGLLALRITSNKCFQKRPRAPEGPLRSRHVFLCIVWVCTRAQHDDGAWFQADISRFSCLQTVEGHGTTPLCMQYTPDTPCMPYMPTLGWFEGSM